MNKHLLFILVVFSIAIAAKSQTNVSGNITSNTTWTKANSPYVLVGNVGVPSAYTLTIKPGVTVQRSGDYHILINGAVKCNGSKADNIVFESTSPRLPNTPYFIEFQKSNLSNSNIKFVSFRSSMGLTNNIRIGNDNNSQTNPQDSGTLHIVHSDLSNGYTVTQGYLTTASMNIDSCVLTSGYIQGNQYYSEPIYITNTQISNATVEGGNYNRGISLTNCEINNVKFLLGCCGANFTFNNSTVENSQIGGSSGERITITNSTFTNTSIFNLGSRCIVTNSKFMITDKLYDSNGFDVDYLFSVGSLIFTNSEITNNSAYTYRGITLSGYIYDTTANPNIINKNRFSNLYDAVTVNDFSAIQLDSNNFYNTGRYDIINYTNKDFSALYNYFQLKQGQTIDDVIYDQNDDLSYGLVTYTPYATDPLVLPLKLLSFTGNRNGQSIQLNWQTSNEVNTLRFVVQRTTGSGFTDIGTVAASGKAGNTANYYFTDKTPAAGTNEYRLKIIDGDGKYTYSAVVPIVFAKTVNGLLLYPNPAKNYVIVQHAAISNDTQLQLIDATGKLAKIVSVVKGSTQTKINVAGMAKGTYRIIWQTKTKKESQLLFVQ